MHFIYECSILLVVQPHGKHFNDCWMGPDFRKFTQHKEGETVLKTQYIEKSEKIWSIKKCKCVEKSLFKLKTAFIVFIAFRKKKLNSHYYWGTYRVLRGLHVQ